MKTSLFIFIYLLMVSFRPPEETDYRKVFGTRYDWAVSWLKQHDGLIHGYALTFNLPEKELKAIVFPELMRYNVFFNALETESLKFLYVEEGKEYADFSIGYFQMKPSFGEMIEQDARGVIPERYRLACGWSSVHVDNEELRRARVKRLSNVEDQLEYLCAFYKICIERFKDRQFTSSEERVRLFATCYNAGYRRSPESLLQLSTRNQFYSYNYSAISAYYYRQE